MTVAERENPVLVGRPDGQVVDADLVDDDGRVADADQLPDDDDPSTELERHPDAWAPSPARAAMARYVSRPLPSVRQLWRSTRWWGGTLKAAAPRIVVHALPVLLAQIRPTLRGIGRGLQVWAVWRCGSDWLHDVKQAEGNDRAKRRSEWERKRRARNVISGIVIVALTVALLVGSALWPWHTLVALGVVLVGFDAWGHRRAGPVETGGTLPMSPLREGAPLRVVIPQVLDILAGRGHDATIVNPSAGEFGLEMDLHAATPLDDQDMETLERGLQAFPGAVSRIQDPTNAAVGRLRIMWKDPLAVINPMPLWEPLSQSVNAPANLGYGLAGAPLYLNFLRTNVIIIGGPGCLAADTRLIVNRGGIARSRTIENLAVHFMSGGRGPRERGARPWDMTIPTYVQREIDGVVRLGRVVDAWCSGVKTTYTLTTDSGRTIRATAEHPFLTERGWVKLGDLAIGDEVRVRGSQAAGRPRRPKNQYPDTKGMANHPYACKSTRAPRLRRVPTHRLTAEATLNGINLHTHVARIRAGRTEGLRFIDPDTHHVHHRDGDHRNSAPSNLEVLTEAEHHRHHALAGHGRHVLYKIVTERVTSIEHYGDEPTYDLEVADDPHNFIADGFVVHNSGKSSCLWCMIDYLAACRDVVLDGIDLSGATALDAWGNCIRNFASTEAEATEVLRDALDLADRRTRAIAGRSRPVRGGPPVGPENFGTADGPAHIILVDELPLMAKFPKLLELYVEHQRVGRKAASTSVATAQDILGPTLGSTSLRRYPSTTILLACSREDVTTALGGGKVKEGWAPHRFVPAEGDDFNDAGKCFIHSGRHRVPNPWRFNRHSDISEIHLRALARMDAGMPTLDDNDDVIDGSVIPEHLEPIWAVFTAAKWPMFMATEDILAGITESRDMTLSADKLAKLVGPYLAPDRTRRRSNGSKNARKGYLADAVREAVRQTEADEKEAT